MKKFAILSLAALFSLASFNVMADDDDTVTQLEDDIKYHEEVVEEKQISSPKVEYEPAPEHVRGYVEEPKENEVLPAENDGDESRRM